MFTSLPQNKTRSEFLLNRQALLDHIGETEKILKGRVNDLKKNDSYYQELLIEKYLQFILSLRVIKDEVAFHAVAQQKNKEEEILAFLKTRMEQSDSSDKPQKKGSLGLTNLELRDEFTHIIKDFNDYLKQIVN